MVVLRQPDEPCPKCRKQMIWVPKKLGFYCTVCDQKTLRRL